MLCSMRCTKIARVEGLWLVNGPNCSVSGNPDDSPKVCVCSSFIVPSQNSMRDHCNVISWCHDCLLWSCGRKTTVHGAQEMPQFICTSASINARIPSYYRCIQTSSSFSLTQIWCLWHSPPGILLCPHTRVLIYLQHLQQNTGRYNK